ncbi:MAG: helix-turn-helix domain-containing protein [Bacteroidaceae bacterium]|nr:helix-turn-helix domain-containing protein [Bacteroidaceae bacterium]
MNKFWFTLWLGICLSVFTLHARDYKFRHIEPRDGLSNSLVNTIYKDSRGFMWFGTSSGLNRYDGYEVKVYRNHAQDIYSLPDSYIHDIKEDGEGLLWVRTSGGYAIYYPMKDHFDRDIRQHVFKFGLEHEPTLVHIDENRDYWFFVSGVGCYWYNVAQKTLYPFVQSEKPSHLPVGEITCITSCKEGALVVYNDGTLACIDGKARRIAWMSDYIPISARPKKGVLSAYVDKNENVWVYGTAGLWIYNKEKDQWISSLALLAEQWGVAVIPAMKDAVVGVDQDANGRYWVATRHYGLLVVDPHTNTFTAIEADKNDPYALRHNSLKSLYLSPEKDIVWIGTAKSGVACYSESAYKFSVAIEENITTMEATADNNLYIGTADKGLWKYDVAKATKSLMDVGKIDWEKNEVQAIYTARDGSLWVGTNRGQIIHKQLDGKIQNYQIMSGGIESVPVSNAVVALVEDDRNNIWVATLGAGLQCIEVRSGKMRVYNKDKNNLPSDKVSSLFINRQRQLLIGTYGGVAVMDLNKRSITTYTGCVNGNIAFSSLYVIQVIEDCRGLWWIATRDGVNIYDVKNDHLEILNTHGGLDNSMICGIAEGGENAMWVTTARGVSNIVIEKNENGNNNYSVYNFTELDGLQGYEFNQRAIAITPNGHVAVGGIHGVNVFDPDKIVYNKLLPCVLFSELRLNGATVEVGKKEGEHVVLEEALGDGARVVLKEGKDIVTILFGSDDYSRPENTRFKFKLEGFRDDWILCPKAQHWATFTNLAPGKYVLMVKAVNSDGYNSDEAAQLIIQVKGTFWTSVWAYLIYIVLLIVGLVALFSFWKRRNRKQWIQLLEKGMIAPATKDSVADEEEMEDDADASVAPIGEIVVPEVPPMLVVVDENPEFLTYLSDSLKDTYRLRLTGNIDEAWERILLQHPDGVLLSIASLESATYELVQRIKSDIRTQAVPLLVLPTRELAHAEIAGADAVLAKPFTPDTLLKHVKALLKGEVVTEAKASMEIQRSTIVETKSVSVDSLLVNNATRYVEENIARTDLTVEEMAREMHMSRAHFYKKLYAATGKNPIDFIRTIRIQRAAELLQNPNYNVSEVAYQVGFNNPRFLTKYFSEKYGMTPMEYHRQFKKKQGNQPIDEN